jgi:hypothetical protein
MLSPATGQPSTMPARPTFTGVITPAPKCRECRGPSTAIRPCGNATSAGSSLSVLPPQLNLAHRDSPGARLSGGRPPRVGSARTRRRRLAEGADAAGGKTGGSHSRGYGRAGSASRPTSASEGPGLGCTGPPRHHGPSGRGDRVTALWLHLLKMDGQLQLGGPAQSDHVRRRCHGPPVTHRPPCKSGMPRFEAGGPWTSVV